MFLAPPYLVLYLTLNKETSDCDLFLNSVAGRSPRHRARISIAVMLPSRLQIKIIVSKCSEMPNNETMQSSMKSILFYMAEDPINSAIKLWSP